MIGVDTNILVRLFVLDDARQHDLAKQFFAKRSSSDPAYVSMPVVMELFWMLTQRYGYDETQVLSVITSMLAGDDFIFERGEVIEETVNLCTQSKAGFADAIIAATAKAAGCTKTVTFDTKAAKRIPGMELLS
jgi:predicted nucleic-acid-binding protein